MDDGGANALRVWRRLARTHLAPDAIPRLPAPRAAAPRGRPRGARRRARGDPGAAQGLPARRRVDRRRARLGRGVRHGRPLRDDAARARRRTLRAPLPEGRLTGRDGAARRERLPPDRTPHEPDGAPLPLRFRTIFISDVHLGTRAARPARCSSSCAAPNRDFLYLVGDIVDGWQLQRRWYWPRRTTTSCRRCCARRARGRASSTSPATTTRRRATSSASRFGGIEIRDEAMHVHRRRPPPAGHARRPLRRRRPVRALARAPRRRALHVHAAAQPAAATRRGRGSGFRYWSLSQFLKHR